MNEQEYEKVRKAAVSLTGNESRDTRALAEAVLKAVPAQPSGKRNDLSPPGGEGSPTEKLAELAGRLEADGVTTPYGDPFTVHGLTNLRETAMVWDGQWQDEAAYRTHEEAGSPNTAAGKALIALCKAARGEMVRRPDGLDPKAWEEAKSRVEMARAKDKKWVVAANTLRLAVGRLPNVPGRTKPPVTEEEVVAAVKGNAKLAAKAATVAMTSHDDVAGKVLEDEDAGRAIRGTQRRETAEANAAAEANFDGKMKERNAEVWRQKHFHGALSHINRARYQIGQAMEELKLIGPLRSKEIAEAKEDIVRLFQAYEWLESAINDGDRSFEEHLAEILGSVEEGGAAATG